MDAVEAEQVSPAVEIKSEHYLHDSDEDKDSAENFQKFIYELFEKNGVLGDLRAYLRKHIVNVLKSAHVGDTPSCQKHFAQRLELSSQALNMLIAEYLLRFEFSYSLSVFVSEIPLANMVFDFANDLMKGTAKPEHLRFKDKDVWSILYYLGVKLDSNNACDLLDMYKKEQNTPLLLCILKCLPMYQSEAPYIEQASSSDSVSSQQSVERDRSPIRRSVRRCRHYDTCRSCHSRLARMKDRWRSKKKEFVKRDTSMNPENVQSLLNDVNAAESSLIDEAFEQLKMVYEQEVEMVRAEEEKRVKRSLANHAMQLMHHRQEMEESFKAREEELERNVRQKKKFLWGLARSLREQHEQMSRAMHGVKYQTHRLSSKEDNLRTQLLEAERALKRRGEDMRAQISGELIVLENHLEDMRKERSTLKRERSEMEQLKLLQTDSEDKIQNLDDNGNKHASCDSLKSDLAILKKYIETMRPDNKCFIERSVLTDLCGVNSKLSIELLNNENGVRASKDDERVKNQVVNDFKKPKNVNFSVTPMEDMYGRESSSNECSELTAIQQLRQENERLREYSRIQQRQISQLSLLASRAHDPPPAPPPPPAPTPASRPRTAPEGQNNTHNVNGTLSANSFGWRKGAGEEISIFSCPQRVFVPGDHVPFIGVLRDRHNDTRRHLINQWRTLRRSSPPPRRSSPLSTERHTSNTAGLDVSSASGPQTPPVSDQMQHNSDIPQSTPRLRYGSQEESRNREKSPKSMLREAKENLKTQSVPKYSPRTCTMSREKSPSSVLREAKLRLRKLEIEAEAVERSYMDFRARQSALRGPHSHSQPPDEALVTKDTPELNIKRSHSTHKMDKFSGESSHSTIRSPDDIDKYLCNYRQQYDLGQKHFKNRNTVFVATNPIPQAFSTKPPENKPHDININNLLETPLIEFRKFYRPQTSTPKTDDRMERPKSPVKENDAPNQSPLKDIEAVETENVDKLENMLEAKKDALIKAKNCKKAELEILKQNINKMYNVVDNEQEPTVTEIKDDSLEIAQVDNNVLRIEVENVNEVSAINVTDNVSQDILLVVESNVDATALPQSDTESEKEKEAISGNMTILISPKSVTEISERAKSPDKSRRSISPEQAARLTRNDVFEAIFHVDPTKTESSHDVHADSSKDPIDDSNSEEKEPLENYTDDFSADVDNYNTSGIRSPISLPKSPTEDNFWDS